MIRSSYIVGVFASLAFVLAITPLNARADPNFLQRGERYSQNETDKRYSQKEQRSGISRAQAVRLASEATGGKVLGVTRVGNNWRVKVLLRNKHIRTVSINARSGQIQPGRKTKD